MEEQERPSWRGEPLGAHFAAGGMCVAGAPLAPTPLPLFALAADREEQEEQANPCICTPRELAAQAAAFLGALLDMLSAAEAAGGFSAAPEHTGFRCGSRALCVHNLRPAASPGTHHIC